MPCPRCAAETRVIDTRSTAGNAVRRRRECVNPRCGFRATSREEYL